MNFADLLVGPVIEDEEKCAIVLSGGTAINNRNIKTKHGKIVELQIKVNMLEKGKFLAFKKTLGIVGMNERCTMFDGEFKIESGPGSGTKTKVIIPVQSNLN